MCDAWALRWVLQVVCVWSRNREFSCSDDCRSGRWWPSATWPRATTRTSAGSNPWSPRRRVPCWCCARSVRVWLSCMGVFIWRVGWLGVAGGVGVWCLFIIIMSVNRGDNDDTNVNEDEIWYRRYWRWCDDDAVDLDHLGHQQRRVERARQVYHAGSADRQAKSRSHQCTNTPRQSTNTTPCQR